MYVWVLDTASTCHGQTVQAVIPRQNVRLSPQRVSERVLPLGQHVIKHAPYWKYVYSTGLKKKIFCSVLTNLKITLHYVVHVLFDYIQLFGTCIWQFFFHLHKNLGFSLTKLTGNSEWCVKLDLFFVFFLNFIYVFILLLLRIGTQLRSVSSFWIRARIGYSIIISRIIITKVLMDLSGITCTYAKLITCI